MTAFTLPVDGGRLFVRDDGQRSAPPVLMLHSLFFDGGMFDALLEHLAHLGVVVRGLRPDHRGQGRSVPTAVVPDMDRLACDMATLIEYCTDGTPVHLVGSSMGAYIAMRLLVYHPELVASATLLCCTADAEQDPARFATLVERLRRETPVAMPDVISRTMFGDGFLGDPARRSEVQHWRRHFAALAATVADAAEAMFTRPGMAPQLVRLGCPLLLFAGALDRAKRPEDMVRIAGLVPGSRLIVLPEAGHTPVVETPRPVAEALAGWWGKGALQPTLSAPDGIPTR